MTVVESSARKARQHTVYKNMDGKRVPGVTTITGVMDKPALVRWANQLGLQGIDSTKYVDDLAAIGTLAHYLIQCHLTGEKPDTSDYSANQIDMAENGLLRFMAWQDETGYVAEWCEKQFVSEIYQYGGTIDSYGTLTKRGNRKALVDIKTAKAIYDDMFTQVAGGYALLLSESEYLVDDVIIVRVGRTAEEGDRAEEKVCPCPDLHEQRFLTCRKLYDLNNQIRKAS